LRLVVVENRWKCQEVGLGFGFGAGGLRYFTKREPKKHYDAL